MSAGRSTAGHAPAGRGGAQKQFKSTKVISAGDESSQPTIRINKPGNPLYSNWTLCKESLNDFFGVKYGVVGMNFMMTGEYSVRKPPVWEETYEEFGPPNGTDTTAEKVFDADCAAHRKKTHRDVEAKAEMFILLFSKCSEEVKELMRGHEDYEAVMASRDALKLRNLLCTVMASPVVGNKHINIQLAEHNFISYKQLSSSLITYKKGFDERYQQVLAAGGPERENDYLVSVFLLGLSPNYASMVIQYRNGQLHDVITDVNEAYRLAMRWVTTTTPDSGVSTDARSAITFVTSVTRAGRGGRGGRGDRGGRGGRGGGQRGGRGRGGAESSVGAGGVPPETKAEQPAGKPELTQCPARGCYNCWGLDHLAKDCKNPKHAKAYVTTCLSAQKKGKAISEREVLLDTCSSINIITNKDFGWNFRKGTPVNVVGVSGAENGLLLEIICDTIWGTAWVMDGKAGPINIVSASAARESGWKRERNDWHDEDILVKDDWRLHFRGGHHGLYTYDGWEVAAFVKSVCKKDAADYIAASQMHGLGQPREGASTFATLLEFAMGPTFDTVEERERLLTRRELVGVNGALELFGRFGWSPVTLVKMLRHGKIRNCTVTPKDVMNCIHVHGPTLDRVSGSTVRAPRRAEASSIFGRIIDQIVTLDIDIVFIETIPFLLGVARQLRYHLCNYLQSRSLRAVKDAVDKQTAKLTSLGFDVKEIRCDGEGAVAAMTTDLNKAGVKVEQCGPDSHLGTIDSSCRILKNAVRGQKRILPFNLPYMLLVFLVCCCVQIALNFRPSGAFTDCVTPLELAYGRPVDLDRDMPLKWGERAEIKQRTTNTLLSRTRPGIFVGSTGNVFGTQRFFMLDTLKVATADQWTALPMDKATIERLNGLAAADKRKVGADPEFKIGNRIIEAAEDTESEQKDFGIDAPPMHVIRETQEAFMDPWVQPLGIIEGSRAVPRGEVIYGTENIANVPTTAEPPAPEPTSVREELRAVTNPGATEPLEGVAADDLEGEAADDLEGVAADDLEGVAAAPPEGVESRNIEAVDREEPAAELAGEELVLDPDSRDPAQVELDPEFRPDRGRYNLRKKRLQGHIDGDWRHRADEHNFQISVKKALEMFGDKATESIMTELLNLIRKKVMFPVGRNTLSRRQIKRLISSKMFLKEKFNSAGIFERIKSRFVAGGHRQDRTIYHESELSSPTVSLSSVYMCAALAACENRHVMSMDIGSAYLNAVMKNEVHMRIEPELAEMLAKIDPAYGELRGPDGSVIVRLDKALYGCIESAKLWHDTLTEKFKSLGFTPNEKDPCVYNKDWNGKQLTVCIYVDDLLCTCADESGLKWLEEKMLEEYKEIVAHHGLVHSYLGQTFDFSVPGKVRVTMAGYVYDLLLEYDVTAEYATPALSTLFEIDDSSPRLSEEKSNMFHSRVAKLLYLSKRVRADILTAVIFLTTRVLVSTEQDMKKLDRVLGYLNATKDMGIVLEAHRDLMLFAYVDASYAVHADMKSHTGGIITLGAGPVWAKSTKQKLNSKSSTEAELIGVSDCLSQVIWARDFLKEQGYDVGPAKLFQDNMSAMAMAKRGSSNSEKTRHIAIRFFFIADRIEAGEIIVEHLGTADMLADVLTKPLQGEMFRRLRSLLLNWE